MTREKGPPLLHIAGVPIERGRVTMVTLAHDATCPTLTTQRSEDCRCDPDVTVEQLPRPEKPG